MVRIGKLIRTGDSFAITIPPKIVEKMGLDLKSYVVLQYQDGELKVSKLESVKTYTGKEVKA